MINKENLKRLVLEELREIAEKGKLESKIEIEKRVLHDLSVIGLTFKREIDHVYKKYRVMAEKGTVGSLEWIYISFLRTSLVDRSSCYRIDFYDSRGCLSEIECAGSWDCDIVFNFYYDILGEIEERAKKKTILKIYEATNVVNDLASYFRQLSDQLITEIIQSMHTDFTKMVTGKNSIKVMMGDFLDDSELVLEVLSNETYKVFTG